MSTVAIRTQTLTKVYRIARKAPGLRGSLRALVQREYEKVLAVDGLDIEVPLGQFVGLIGPNGAGKTTTLKMLTGVLYPTSGHAEVLGHIPHLRKNVFLRQITLVSGQKGQLNWNLPPMETFLLNKAIYEIPERRFETALADLAAVLDAGDLFSVQTRKLSLGQRMKCELIASLLHDPSILFLDEPTIGLDVVSQQSVREFLLRINREQGKTIILTSHYVGDIRDLCQRVIVIQKGRAAFDGPPKDLAARYVRHKQITVTSHEPLDAKQLAAFGEIHEFESCRAVLRVSLERHAEAASALSRLPAVADLLIEDPRIEDVIADLYRNSA